MTWEDNVSAWVADGGTPGHRSWQARRDPATECRCVQMSSLAMFMLFPSVMPTPDLPYACEMTELCRKVCLAVVRVWPGHIGICGNPGVKGGLSSNKNSIGRV